MALVLSADVNDVGFNSYSTVLEADDYHDARLFNTNWTSATTGDKEKALVWATRSLDTLSWRGVQTSGTQNLKFPRLGLSYQETSSSTDYGSSELYDSALGEYSTTVAIPSDEVPDFLRDACAELSLYMLEKDITSPTGTEGFKLIEVDTVKLQMDSKDRLSWFNASVKNLVWRFLANNAAFNVPTRRVG